MIRIGGDDVDMFCWINIDERPNLHPSQAALRLCVKNADILRRRILNRDRRMILEILIDRHFANASLLIPELRTKAAIQAVEAGLGARVDQRAARDANKVGNAVR